MRLHYLQHVPFEGLGNIKLWTQSKSHSISRTLLFKNEQFPLSEEFDWLIIMGGPMNIYEEEKYPWLAKEKKFIARAIENNKTVLGICLGAQLIADVLGGKVRKNSYKEIGWYPVALTQEASKSQVFSDLPGKMTVFHWHGDTFDLPPGCTRLAKSEGCLNQAFQYNDRVIGLQFHLEFSAESIKQLVESCKEELVEGKYIQTPEQLLAAAEQLPEMKRIMTLMLNNLERVSL